MPCNVLHKGCCSSKASILPLSLLLHLATGLTGFLATYTGLTCILEVGHGSGAGADILQNQFHPLLPEFGGLMRTVLVQDLWQR